MKRKYIKTISIISMIAVAGGVSLWWTRRARDFRSSGVAKDQWRLYVPPGFGQIQHDVYSVRDIYYETVSFAGNIPSLESLFGESIAHDRYYNGEDINKLSDFSVGPSVFFEIFVDRNDSALKRWLGDGSGAKCETVIWFWQRSEYGNGYLGIYDPEISRVRILAFLQQHLTWAKVNKLLKNAGN